MYRIDGFGEKQRSSKYRFRFEVGQVKKKKKEVYVTVNFVKDGSATKKIIIKKIKRERERERERESCNVSAALEGWPTSLSS